MTKYVRAYKVKDGILIQEHKSYFVYSESDLKDFCRQNGLKLKPYFYETKCENNCDRLSGNACSKCEIVSYYAE